MEMEITNADSTADDGDKEESTEMLDMKVIKAMEGEDEEEKNVYTKLKNPSEDVYQMATLPTQPEKHRTSRTNITRFRLFRAVAAILSVICLTLLMVIIALATKLQTQSACEAQNTMKKGSDVSSLCSKEHCMSIYPQSQVYTTNCQKCGKGWVEFEAFCFFFSRERHTWSESRKECQKRGGDLTVLDQDRVQNFLSKMSKDFCWIGLSRSPSGQWAWVDNTTLGKSYWSEDSMWADCAYMDGSMLANQSWKTAECSVVTYYICQKNR